MPRRPGSRQGLAQLEKMQGFAWGDPPNDQAAWIDGDTLFFDGQIATRKGPVVNVRALGAVGNGVDDDTQAILAAVAAASGGIVYFPPGTYKITAPITGGTAGIRLVGSGRAGTIISNYGSGHAITTPAGIRGYTVEHLQILGQTGSLDCIHATADFGHVRLVDLYLKPASGGDGVDITEGNGIDLYMESVRVDGGSKGFNLASGGTAVNTVTAIDCYAQGNSAASIGFGVSNIADCTLIGCAADNCTSYGYQIGGNFTAIGCSAESNTTRGFTVVGSCRATFIDCHAQSQSLPFHVSAPDAEVVFVNPRSVSTPAGASLTIDQCLSAVLIGGAQLDGGLSGTATTALTTTIGTTIRASGALKTGKGADVASANDLTLGSDGNLFHVTGTTQINRLDVTDWQAGSEVTLIFDSSLTVKHNQAGSTQYKSVLLAGAVDFAATANDTLTLMFDGSNWYEKARAVI